MHFNTKWDFFLHSFTLMSTWNKINVGCQNKKILFFVFDNLLIIFSNEIEDCHIFSMCQNNEVCTEFVKFKIYAQESDKDNWELFDLCQLSVVLVIVVNVTVLFKFFHIFILSRNTESISVKIRKKWNSCSFNWKEMLLSKGRY